MWRYYCVTVSLLIMELISLSFSLTAVPEDQTQTEKPGLRILCGLSNWYYTQTHTYTFTHTQFSRTLRVSVQLCWMMEQLMKVWHKQVCLWTENSLNYTLLTGLEPFSRLIKRVSFADIHWEDKKPCFFFVKFGESGREFVKHNNDDYDNDCV